MVRKPRTGLRVRDVALGFFALVVAFVLVAHQAIPDVAGLVTVVESVLPWIGLLIPILLVLGLVGGVRAGLVALLVPAIAWTALFGPAMLPKTPGGAAQLSVVSQNIGASNANPCTAMTALAAQKADLVAVQELTDRASGCDALSNAYQYRYRSSSVRLWSRYPLRPSKPLMLGLDWARAFRTEVITPNGNVVIYAVHLPSARVDATVQRNRGLAELAELIRDESGKHVLVVGDLNTASTDRQMTAFAGLTDSQQAAGSGLGFTWPAGFPITRPDHLLTRGLRPVAAGTLPGNGSDHLAISGSFRFE
ncbi:endonuclease/exonuclease/phosphatase family protein [Fodinicola acaciae]|uniref:endonuclease/exonuclease/phosphatase family protein n=1 Tax=Fodinicola acaciae TaxID=2681555 RepID=UPI0013D83447|nr:endonuclease/exonuclease/phosphatase family protein [Fodinicola acaciae]